jgi:2-polyprenyl-6-methoxyphenol hydroxylase-like FAD-dependent oxidoreductase
LTDAAQIPHGRAPRARWFVEQLRAMTLLDPVGGHASHPLDVRGCAAGTTAREIPSGTGWCVAGDARIAVDPLAGNGLLRAVQDGARAACLVVRMDTCREHAAFARQHREEFLQILRLRRKYYGAPSRFDTPFWHRMRSSHPL